MQQLAEGTRVVLAGRRVSAAKVLATDLHAVSDESLRIDSLYASYTDAEVGVELLRAPTHHAVCELSDVHGALDAHVDGRLALLGLDGCVRVLADEVELEAHELHAQSVVAAYGGVTVSLAAPCVVDVVIAAWPGATWSAEAPPTRGSEVWSALEAPGWSAGCRVPLGVGLEAEVRLALRLEASGESVGGEQRIAVSGRGVVVCGG